MIANKNNIKKPVSHSPPLISRINAIIDGDTAAATLALELISADVLPEFICSLICKGVKTANRLHKSLTSIPIDNITEIVRITFAS